MVAIVDKLNANDQNLSAARIIQWLGGERAVDVPAEYDLSTKHQDTVDHRTPSSDVLSIELLRHPALNKQITTTFEQSLFLRCGSIRRSRLSPDTQTTDEAYSTLLSHQSISHPTPHALIRQGSTSASSSLSTATPPALTISMDDICTTFDRRHSFHPMDDEQAKDGDMSLLREIAQETPHILPLVRPSNARSMEAFRNMVMNDAHASQDLKQTIGEFIQLIESKLSDAETTIFDHNTTRASSPSLFDMLNDLKTCLTLLRRTEVQSLLDVFDDILKLHFHSSQLPDNEEITVNNHASITVPSVDFDTKEELLKLSHYAIDELKIVHIEKTHQPLGLTISRTDSGTIYIARIVVGGTAATSDLFQMYDRILEINDEPITGRSLDYVTTSMSNTIGLIKFLLAPPINKNSISHQTFHVRALYAYDPLVDPLIPCNELGLAFQRGDILRVVAHDDTRVKVNDASVSWWQAYRETSTSKHDDSSLAGLIPSDDLQQKRSDFLKAIADDTGSICSSSSLSLFNRKNKKTRTSRTCFTCVRSKHERKPLQSVYNNASFIRDKDDRDTGHIRKSTNHFSLTDSRHFGEEKSYTIKRRLSDDQKDLPLGSFRFYEPVFRLNPSIHRSTRPIVLLGAPNVGRHELRRRLLQTEPHLFDIAVPHTTRAVRSHETPDVDYHFISESDFSTKMYNHAFVEFGQYDRDLYGTSLDDIREIVTGKRKICILNLNPDAIRTFDQTDLYPFVICIAAPSFERLKRLELDRREHLTDKDYREIIRQSRSIERRHRLLFDQVLINNDLDRTYNELRDLIVRIQHDNQQWVRSCYQRSQ